MQAIILFYSRVEIGIVSFNSNIVLMLPHEAKRTSITDFTGPGVAPKRKATKIRLPTSFICEQSNTSLGACD